MEMLDVSYARLICAFLKIIVDINKTATSSENIIDEPDGNLFFQNNIKRN